MGPGGPLGPTTCRNTKNSSIVKKQIVINLKHYFSSMFSTLKMNSHHLKLNRNRSDLHLQCHQVLLSVPVSNQNERSELHRT